MKRFLLGCALAAVIAPVAVHAQETTGTIRGEVTSSGTPVVGAEVTITNVPSGTVTTTTTGEDGTFNASGLRVGGPFSVRVSANGQESTVTDISITAGLPFRLPIELAAAGEEEVVVTGTRNAREQSQGPITTLTREEIEGVASVTRDVRDIVRRDPFANLDPSNSRTVEIAGQNGRLNRFSVDGVQFSDDFGLNNGGLPTTRGPVPFDAIEQLSVKVAPFDIEEGDFQGGAINVVLRSGTNKFTGSAFYSQLNEDLTGDKIRGVPVSLNFKSEQYGAFLAGPIIRDRLFFALAYERLKEGDPVDTGPSGLGFANSIPRVDQAAIDQITGVAQSRFDFDTGGVFSTAVEQDEKITGKIDFNITDGQRASLTYIRNTGTQQFDQGSSTTPTSPAFGFQSNGYELQEEVNSGVFQLNSDWGDNFSTELRVSYRDTNRDQTPFAGREFAQFEVCLDPVSVGSPTQCTQASAASGNNPAVLATPRVFFGPDISRQSNDLNTDNLSIDLSADYTIGAHSLKVLAAYTDFDAFNLFLQRSLGDFYFDSIADFQAGRASRLRLSNAVPSGNINDAAAIFSVKTITFGFQDDIDVSDTFQLSAGFRYDAFFTNDQPALNANFTARNGFSNQTTLDNKGIFQPRIGFNWEAADRLIIRGGGGIFGGGSPEVFLSNSFSNTGQLTNSIDIQRTATGFSGLTGLTAAQQTAVGGAALNNVNGRTFDPSVLSFLQTNTASLAAATTNAFDPEFDPSSQFRGTLSVNYDANLGPLGDNYLLGADLLYGEVVRGIDLVDLRSVPIGTAPDGRPRYGPVNNVATTNQDLLLTNDNRGRSIIAVARVSKQWDFGLGVDASYTFQDIEDVNAITSATANSLYGNNAFADPNRTAYGTSVYEVRHAYKLSLDFNRAFFGDYETRFNLFGEYRSGRPFSYTFRDPSQGRSAVFGTTGSNTRYLFYVPTGPSDPIVSYDSDATRDAVNAFIDGSSGLSRFRGRIVPKNTGRSPDFFKVDLHVDQELPTFIGSSRFKIYADIENVLNLIDSDWGVQRQVNFPSFAPLVNVACATAAGGTPAAGTCPAYRYSSFAPPTLTVQNQNRQSLYQIRIGARFEF